jgi:hypothetical protein
VALFVGGFGLFSADIELAGKAVELRSTDSRGRVSPHAFLEIVSIRRASYEQRD